jgi:SAM-dependent methyltransferase
MNAKDVMTQSNLPSLKQFYRGFAADYAEHCDRLKINNVLETEVECLASYEPMSVLEYGVGDGRFAKAFLDRHPVSHYVGVDISPEMLAFIQDQRITEVCQDMESFAAAAYAHDECFDVCIAPFTVLHHVKTAEQRQQVEALLRIAKTVLLNVFAVDADNDIHQGRESPFTLFNGMTASTFPIDLWIRHRANATWKLNEQREYLILKR